jgi:DNA polymerase-3 subunit gamma/tau
MVAVPALTTAQFRDSWNAILSLVEKKSKAAWVIAYTLAVVDFTDDVLTLRFASQNDLESFKSAGQAPEILREAIRTELGVTVKFKPHVEVSAATTPIAVVAAPAETVKAEPAKTEPVESAKPQATEPAEEAAPEVEPTKAAEPKVAAKSRKADIPDDERYGESILREFGAKPLDDPAGGR